MAERQNRGARVRLGVIIAAVIGSLAFAAAPASANVSHAFTTSFGAAGSTPANPYPLSGPTDVDVDQASHDFYVTDPGNHRVEKFDSTGNLLLMFGKGVDQTTGGNICTVASGHTCQAGTSSSAAGGFQTPAYLAVDNYPGGQGDIYVADIGDNLVQKFDSSGNLITSWGSGGQKNGADATDLSAFGSLYGLAVGGGCATPTSKNTGKTCSPNGTLYVGSRRYNTNVFEYTQDGTYIKWSITNGAPWVKVDPMGNMFSGGGTIGEAVPQLGAYQDTTNYQVTTDSPTTGFAFDPSSQELYQDTSSVVDHYSDCNPPLHGPCSPDDSFGSGHLSGSTGVGVDGESHTVYVANSTGNDVSVFGDARPIVTTGQPTGATQSSVTLTGSIDPAGRGDITSCHFEYGFNTEYGSTVPCTPDPSSSPPGSNFTGLTDVTATVSGFSPGTKDHYRLVATNTAGATSNGSDQTFFTTQPPTVNGLSSANLTPTSADLNAVVNPNGLDTTYRFEYGPTLSYGTSKPVPDGTLSASNSDQSISVHLDNLQPGVVYHYRLVAINDDGTTATGDQTFNFYPPPCPNENVRQQTQANYLPDCRAYELVSPGDAAGTQLFPTGPNTGYATNPPRFSYSGMFGTIPGSGGKPIDGTGDLYVATRTDSGWVSRYVGLPADQAAVDGGPPMGPPNSTPAPDFRSPTSMPSAAGRCPTCQNYVLTDPGMNTFADFNVGNQSIESIFTLDFGNHTVVASNAPYVWSADGKAIDRWPTNLASVPSGNYPASSGDIFPHGGSPSPGEQALKIAPGGVHALDCPGVRDDQDPSGLYYNDLGLNYCPGDVTASLDLSHFVFATEWNAFAPGGQLGAPGSVYDNDTIAASVAVASKTPLGDDIPSEPGDLSSDPLQIPAVSSDGSHILMAAGGTGPCGVASCEVPYCGDDYSAIRRCQMQPSHLYMRVDGTVTYDVSQGYDVSYVGESGDGSKVYFTSDQQLTPDDTDTSVDLYMWSEDTNSLTRVSAGSNGAGNSDSCNVDFVTQCGAATYTYNQQFYCQLGSPFGGNCLSDNFISKNGDIYFSSPEQLDGSRGIPNQENLYVYRGGQVQYVTTLTGPAYCYTDGYSFSNECTRIVRMQVSPDDSHMAFVSSSQITQYDNNNRLEMYTYDPSTRKITCVSCIPSSAPPSSDVLASQDGLFMANDGRAFFSTSDPLVHADTNNSVDVYEYVDGRPQLITPGTGETNQPRSGGLSTGGVLSPGLIGVSADGADVYFGTYQTLVPADHNGLFFKIYDARSGGGFPAPAPPPPCAAADECHGAGSLPSGALSNGTGAQLGAGGNATPPRQARHRRKHHKRSHKHHHNRAVNAKRGGSR